MLGKELSNKLFLMTYSHDKVPGCKIRIRGIQADAVLGSVEELGRESVIPHHPLGLSAKARHLMS